MRRWTVREVGAVAVLAGSLVRATHTLAAARAIPTLGPPRPGAVGERRPPVTVVVPARNEERVLQECLTGLQHQDYPDLSVVVVDDDSADRTGVIARQQAERDPRLQVVQTDGLPTGWLGKLHAMHVGLQTADATGPVDPEGWLLFLDADTVPASDLLQRLVATAEDRGLDLLSAAGGPPPEAGAVWWLLMPAGSQVISEHASPVIGHRALALGHCLLVRRSWFDRVGGWEARPAVGNEDIALATAVRAAGGRTRLVRVDGAATSRGLDPFPAGWASFRKSFTVGVRRSVPMLVAAGVAHVAFGVTPTASVLVGSGLVGSGRVRSGPVRSGPVGSGPVGSGPGVARRRSPVLVTAGLVAALAQAVGHLQATRVTGGPAVSALLAPASWVSLGGLFLDAARTSGRSQWKGRRMDGSRRPPTARPARTARTTRAARAARPAWAQRPAA